MKFESIPASFTQYLEWYAEQNGIHVPPLRRGMYEYEVRKEWKKRHGVSFPHFSITIDCQTQELAEETFIKPFTVHRFSGNTKDIGNPEALLNDIIDYVVKYRYEPHISKEVE